MNGTVSNIVLILFLPFTSLLSEVHWATDVVAYSSQYGAKQYSANQALGKPSTFQNVKSPCAWTPLISESQKYEYIQLGFDSPEAVKYVYININLGSKALTAVNIIDNRSNEVSIFKPENIIADSSGRITIGLDKPTTVSSVKLYFALKSIDTEAQLDAVGIGNEIDDVWRIQHIDNNLFTAEPENMGIRINSSSSELAPVISADGKKLFFTRDKHPENMGADKKQDVWLSQLEEDGRFGKAVNLYEPVNSKDNNFAFSTNSDGRMLLMGRNANDANKSNLSITKYDSGKWSEIQDFDFVKLGNTSPLVSFSLSQSQNLMLISMERGDSYGGLDIYYSERTDNGWSEVKNLGSSINTAADEITPYIANDNRTIYFASNGYAGYGNMDLFVSRADDSLKNWSEPTNLGSNINTEGWEAYFTISSTNDYAYFVSTSNSIGKEDIFRVKLPQVAQPQKSVLVYGTVSELNSKHPIASTVEFRYLEDNKIVGIAYSDSTDGKYGISLPLGKLYSVNAFATGYYSLSKNIEIDSNFDENRAIDLVLKKIEVGQTYDMNNIFFEFGKSKLNTKSVNELQKLVKLLKSDSSLKILIIGYTDSIGSSEDNRKLSEDRAKAVYDYLVENGINKNRLEYEGKGELKSNNNSNLERSRKVVFKIVEDN